MVFPIDEGLHLKVVPAPASDLCVICRDSEGEMGCQRCGVRFHAELLPGARRLAPREVRTR